MKIKQYIKMGFQNLFLPVVYRISQRGGTDPSLVIFADAHHDERPDNMQLLIRALENGPCKIEEIYLDYQRHSPLKVFREMIRFMRRYARAGCVVICDNFLPAAGCRKRPETKVVQLWHASGSLKKFGYDTTDDIPAGYRGNVFRNTDLVTVSAPWCAPHFASAMRLPAENVQAMGISRTDRYYDPQWRRQAAEKLAQAFPEAAGKKLAVWAPTFRGSPGAPESIPFDAGRLQQQLGDEWYVIVSTHPHMRDGKILITTEELFVSADCLIADYSSLIYEYLLLAGIMEGTGASRKLVLYIPDYDTYVSRRGFYMPYDDIPGIRVRDFDSLPSAILGSGEAGFEGNMTREAFLRRYMCACDGASTERIAAYITGTAGNAVHAHG